MIITTTDQALELLQRLDDAYGNEMARQWQNESSLGQWDSSFERESMMEFSEKVEALKAFLTRSGIEKVLDEL